ncbi:MAG: Ig-like domain-containing protein, partial [Gemmatimonadetes bacterium]|nr:Ig-like domain-containing protein [Gemmatimonadota bacterium]
QVQAGDNQQGEPGRAVDTRPAVVVRDAAGRAVPGVAVNFSVDSGGGTVSVASVSTGADGSASPGDWTLGSTEGRHVLSARSGSLTPVKLVATAKLRPTTVSTGSIGSGGGSITVTTSGPLTGLKLEVPAGALPEPVSISVGYSSAIGIPLDSVARVASVLVTLETDAVNAASELFTITIPAKLAADEIPTVIVVDPVTGFLRALATVRHDSTSVTAELGTLALNPTLPALAAARPVGGPASARLTLPPGPKMHLLAVAANQSKMSKSIDALFRPGVDDWDFARQDTPLGPTSFGQVASADYVFRKGGSSQKLWDRFDLAKGIPTSNTLGISWTAGFSARVNAQVQRHVVAAAARRAHNPALYDVVAEMNLFMAMLLSGKPQVVVMVLPGNVARPILAYKWAGTFRQIAVANPLHPGDLTRLLSVTTGGLDCGGPCFAVLGLNYFDQVLASDWTDVQAGTSPYGFAFPRAFAHISSSAVWTTGGKVDTIWMVRDTASIWTSIPSWPHQLPDPAPGATKTQYQEVYYEKGSWASSQSGSSSSAHQLDVQVLRTPATAPGVDIAMGVEARAVWPPVGNSAATKWAGFKLYRVIKYNPTLTGVYGPLGGQTDLTVANGGGPALPGNFVYVIEWGDGQKQVYQSAPRTVNHSYPDHQAR